MLAHCLIDDICLAVFENIYILIILLLCLFIYVFNFYIFLNSFLVFCFGGPHWKQVLFCCLFRYFAYALNTLWQNSSNHTSLKVNKDNIALDIQSRDNFIS